MEKNKDKNKGINIKLNGIKNLNVSSKVKEFSDPIKSKKKKPNP